MQKKNDITYYKKSQENCFIIQISLQWQNSEANEGKIDKFNVIKKKILHGETHVIQSQKTNNELGKIFTIVITWTEFPNI